jgi:general transcriptional corepressor CYC8
MQTIQNENSAITNF